MSQLSWLWWTLWLLSLVSRITSGHQSRRGQTLSHPPRCPGIKGASPGPGQLGDLNIAKKFSKVQKPLKRYSSSGGSKSWNQLLGRTLTVLLVAHVYCFWSAWCSGLPRDTVSGKRNPSDTGLVCLCDLESPAVASNRDLCPVHVLRCYSVY